MDRLWLAGTRHGLPTPYVLSIVLICSWLCHKFIFFFFFFFFLWWLNVSYHKPAIMIIVDREQYREKERNTCCGHPPETPRQGVSNEHPQNTPPRRTREDPRPLRRTATPPNNSSALQNPMAYFQAGKPKISLRLWCSTKHILRPVLNITQTFVPVSLFAGKSR